MSKLLNALFFLQKAMQEIVELLPLWVFFVMGLLLRLILAPFASHPFDILGLFLKVESLFTYQMNPFFIWSFGLFYMLILLSFNSLTFLLRMNGITGVLVEQFVFKLPYILTDLGVSILLFQIVKVILNDEKRAKFISLAFFFNPLVWFVSSVHGMFDSVVAFWLVLGIFSALLKREVLSYIFLVLSISVKLFPVFIFPFFLLYFFSQERHINFYISVFRRIINLFPAMLLLVLNFGIFLTDPLILRSFIRSLFWHVGENTGSISQFSTISLWRPLVELNILDHLPVFFVNNIFLISSVVVVLLIFLKRGMQRGLYTVQNLLTDITIVVLLLVLLNPTAVYQHFIWTIPLLLLLSVLGQPFLFTMTTLASVTVALTQFYGEGFVSFFTNLELSFLQLPFGQNSNLSIIFGAFFSSLVLLMGSLIFESKKVWVLVVGKFLNLFNMLVYLVPIIFMLITLGMLFQVVDRASLSRLTVITNRGSIFTSAASKFEEIQGGYFVKFDLEDVALMSDRYRKATSFYLLLNLPCEELRQILIDGHALREVAFIKEGGIAQTNIGLRTSSYQCKVDLGGFESRVTRDFAVSINTMTLLSQGGVFL